MNIRKIKGKGNIVKYLEKIGLFNPFEFNQPKTFDELDDYIEKYGYIYWSYIPEDADQIENDVFMVCIGRGENKEIRYYELNETEQW